MPPLLYIILLSAVLFLMLHWILSASENPGRQTRIKAPDRDSFSWESAQELFKYLEAEEFYLAPDSIRLQPAASGQARVYWRFSRAKWQESMWQLGNQTENKRLIVRLHRDKTDLPELDAEINEPAGSHEWDIKAESGYYCSLGLAEGDNYIPLLTSPKLASGEG